MRTKCVLNKTCGHWWNLHMSTGNHGFSIMLDRFLACFPIPQVHNVFFGPEAERLSKSRDEKSFTLGHVLANCDTAVGCTCKHGWNIIIWVCLKMLCTPKPNGFADHYPYEKWLFHWEYTLFHRKHMKKKHEQTISICSPWCLSWK